MDDPYQLRNLADTPEAADTQRGLGMRYRQLGKTDIEMSEYGLGTWAMGGGAYGVTDDAESIRTIHRAQELGVTFLDTAPMYGHGVDGRSETVCGDALRGRRERWILSSKFGRYLSEDDDGKRIIVEDYLGNLDPGPPRTRSLDRNASRWRDKFLSPSSTDVGPHWCRDGSIQESL